MWAPFFQQDRNAGKHVNGAILLHVAAVFNDDTAPVATDSSTGAHIYVLTNDDITRDGRLRVNERRFMHNRDEVFE
jgi:hypothetical protein